MLKKLKKIVIGFAVSVVSIVVLTALYFSDNIKGYYKFKHLCETEGGLTVYGKLEPNVGWEVVYRRNAYIPAGFEQVAFVRFPDDKDKSKLLDLKHRSGSRNSRKSFDITDANLLEKTQYRFIYKNERIDKKLLISKTNLKIIDTENDSLLLESVGFGYSMFDRNKTILAAPSGRRCMVFDFDVIGENFK